MEPPPPILDKGVTTDKALAEEKIDLINQLNLLTS